MPKGAAKAAGRPAKAKPKASAPDNVIDIMSKLNASLAQRGGRQKPARGPRAKMEDAA